MNTSDVKQLKILAQKEQYIAHGDPSLADCIIGFSFGYRESSHQVSPGLSNQHLARFIEQTFNKPLILQIEIAEALLIKKPHAIIKQHRVEGKYLDSREIAEQAYEVMKSSNWQTALVVAHPCMLARNDHLCTALGISTVTISGLEQIPFDPESAQSWTRDRQSWWSREDKVIDYCFQMGWLVNPLAK